MNKWVQNRQITLSPHGRTFYLTTYAGTSWSCTSVIQTSCPRDDENTCCKKPCGKETSNGTWETAWPWHLKLPSSQIRGSQGHTGNSTHITHIGVDTRGEQSSEQLPPMRGREISYLGIRSSFSSSRKEQAAPFWEQAYHREAPLAECILSLCACIVRKRKQQRSILLFI